MSWRRSPFSCYISSNCCLFRARHRLEGHKVWEPHHLLLMRLVAQVLLQCPALASNLDLLNSSQSFPSKFQDPDFQARSQVQVWFGVTCVTSLCKNIGFGGFGGFGMTSITIPPHFYLLPSKTDEDSLGSHPKFEAKYIGFFHKVTQATHFLWFFGVLNVEISLHLYRNCQRVWKVKSFPEFSIEVFFEMMGTASAKSKFREDKGFHHVVFDLQRFHPFLTSLIGSVLTDVVTTFSVFLLYLQQLLPFSSTPSSRRA